MNRRQKKKEFNKHVYAFPGCRYSKAGIPLKKEARKYHFDLIREDRMERDHQPSPI